MIEKFKNSWKYSIQGIKYTWKNEFSFRIEVILGSILIPIAFFIADHRFELIFLVFSVTFVWTVELLNTAIEALADRFGPEHHALSGAAKDAGSAAVFISILFGAFVWIYALIDAFIMVSFQS